MCLAPARLPAVIRGQFCSARIWLSFFGRRIPTNPFSVGRPVVPPSAWLEFLASAGSITPVFLPRPYIDGVIAFSWEGTHALRPNPIVPLTREKQAPEKETPRRLIGMRRAPGRLWTALPTPNALVRLTLAWISVASSGYDPGPQAALQARSPRRSSAKPVGVDAVSGAWPVVACRRAFSACVAFLP